MDAKHTRGPWAIEMERDQQVEIGAEERRLGDGPWEALAVVYGAYDQPEIGAEIMRANASLIAAAPDLLEALRDLCAVASAFNRGGNLPAADPAREQIGIALESAYSVIAKAEGR